MTLVLPNLQEKQMGQVITTITVTNRIDRVMAERGFISTEEVRSVTLAWITLLSIPEQLCFPCQLLLLAS